MTSCFREVILVASDKKNKNIFFEVLLPVRFRVFFFLSLMSLRAPTVSCQLIPARATSPFIRQPSEDADSLCEALYVGVLSALLVVGGRCRRRRNQVSRVRQSVLLGKHLPATVVALVGDVAFPQFGLQLPQVQPGFIVLAVGMQRYKSD